jgi:hypothetical protein
MGSVDTLLAGMAHFFFMPGHSDSHVGHAAGHDLYPTRQDAGTEVLYCIEMFNNPKPRHNTSNGVSPVEFEKRQFQRLGSVW